GVKIGDRQAVVKCKILGAAVACAYLQLVAFQVELDLKIAACVRDRSRSEAARADIERDVPPMIDTRVSAKPYLADDLQIKVQRIFCRPPGVEGHFGELAVSVHC